MPASMPWWKQSVVYEIYIRSFQDSNDDGVGDLNGIARRLDFLAELGVDAIWITPFYPSPQVDFGYDVSNHEDVDPQFGTLADFDRLIAAAHARGIKVILDMVLNHTSDQHPWFEDSRGARSSPYRDWYIWRDGAGGGTGDRPPNNWESAFGGPAWTFDARTGQWYYHFFYPQQPDLNWRNPLVEQRMFDTLEFWMDRGVDGLRLDAVNALFEDPALRDNPPLPEPKLTLTGIRTQDFVHTRRLPELHEVLRRLRRFVDRHSHDIVLISEAYVDTVGDLVRFYGDGDAMHLPFNFFLAQVRELDAREFRRAVYEVERGVRRAMAVARPEQPRHRSRMRSVQRSGRHRSRRQASCDAAPDAEGHTLPVLRRGDRHAHAAAGAPRGGARSGVGRTFWPRYKGRDGVRRPMAWDGGPGAGFTSGTPWLAIAPEAAERNVARQLADPGSVLSFHRALLRFRRGSDALRGGAYRSLPSGPGVFAFLRWSATETVLVVLNMSGASRYVDLGDLAGVGPRRWRVGLGSHRPVQPAGNQDSAIVLEGLRLDAFEALLLVGSAD